MDAKFMRNEARRLMDQTRNELLQIEAFETKENEQRLTTLFQSVRMRLVRLRRLNAARYRLHAKNGSIEPITLLDAERVSRKLKLEDRQST